MSANPTPSHLSIDERFQQLEQRIADNQRQTQEQFAEILKLLQPAIAPSERTDGSPLPEQIASFISRRSMLKKAAMATLGAAAVLETMPSARATDDSALLVGEMNTSSSVTQLSSSKEFGTTLIVSNTAKGAGIEGISVTNSGVYGMSNSGNGVAGTSTSSYGVFGSSTSGYGVKGSSAGNGSAGVYGTGTGSSSYGVSGSGTYIGVYGKSGSPSGAVGGLGTGIGLRGSGSRYGAYLSGALAPLALDFNVHGVSDPNHDSNEHSVGEVFVDVLGGLWYCVSSGMPGIWRKVADNGTAGSLTLLPGPTRFIDTRTSAESPSSTPGVNAPPPGSMPTVQPYTFTGTGALTPYTPPGGTAPVIPFGATSLFGRVTVLSGKNGHTATKGIVQVSNENPPGFGSGLINWDSTPAIQATPFLLPLDNSSGTSGKLYFLNTSSTDEIDILVDVTGYYY